MIVYFDTSAFVPLLLEEQSSTVCRELWDDAHAVTTTRIMYAEAAAALSQGVRLGRVTAAEHRAAVRVFDRYWDEFEVVEVDQVLVSRAARLAHEQALRGYDAVHCAAAEQLEEPQLLVAAGDKQLLAACRAVGLATANVNDLDA